MTATKSTGDFADFKKTKSGAGSGEAGNDSGASLDKLIEQAMPRILPVVALRQHRLDKAAGIERLTRRVEYVLTALNRRRQVEAARYGEAMFWRNLLDDRRARVKRLVETAESAEDKAAFLTQVLQLEAEAELAAEKLEALNG